MSTTYVYLDPHGVVVRTLGERIFDAHETVIAGLEALSEALAEVPAALRSEVRDYLRDNARVTPVDGCPLPEALAELFAETKGVRA